jgi:hypothetical protein
MSGRGNGRSAAGAGRPPNNQNPQRGGVSSSTVDENMRINFTRQLLKLRDESVKEVVFPSTLDNIERKFLHKLSEELGLKSKSHGKGTERKITVSKVETSFGGSNMNEDGDNDGNDIDMDSIPAVNLQKKTLKILQNTFFDDLTSSNSTVTATTATATNASTNIISNNNRKSNVPSAASQANEIEKNYFINQNKMKSNKSYKEIQEARKYKYMYMYMFQVPNAKCYLLVISCYLL